jgi:hypothetical protein
VRGRFATQSACDGFENSVHVRHHVVIPKAQDAIIMFVQPLVAQSVVGIISVLAAIKFNNQSLLTTGEVDDVPANGLLPHKFSAFNRT